MAEKFFLHQTVFTPLQGAGGYFTQDVDVSHLSSGMYLVNLITDKESLSCKFVNE